MGNKCSKLEKCIKITPIIFTGGLIVFYLLYLRDITVQEIVNYVPPNYILAFLLLMVLYAVKSLSIVFPRIILYVSAGIIFSLPIALLVNLAGAAVCLSVPYWVGHFCGKERVLRLTAKYPKVEKVAQMGSNNALFSAYILRAIGFLPGDLVSMFLGAANMHYATFLLGSLLGWLPGLVFQTLLGASINETPTLGMIVAFIFLVGLSLCISRYLNKKAKAHEEESNLKQL